MSESTVFTAAATTDAIVAPVTTTTLPPEVSEFVGTGKKYATEVDALKSIPHAQKHISTLEAELIKANEELAKRKTTEAILEEIRASSTSQATTTAPVGVTVDQMTQMINQTLLQKETEIKEKTNVNQVTSLFTAKYGDKAEAAFIQIATDTGISVEALNRLAATSPGAVLKLAGIENKRNTPIVTKPTGSVNTETFKQNNDGTTLTAKVTGGSTKDLVSAWKIAGQKIGKTT